MSPAVAPNLTTGSHYTKWIFHQSFTTFKIHMFVFVMITIHTVLHFDAFFSCQPRCQISLAFKSLGFKFLLTEYSMWKQQLIQTCLKHRKGGEPLLQKLFSKIHDELFPILRIIYAALRPSRRSEYSSLIYSFFVIGCIRRIHFFFFFLIY